MTADAGLACEFRVLDTIFGPYAVDHMRVGENKTKDCFFDNNSSMKAVFFCEQNHEKELTELRPVFNCIKTNNTINFETLANVSDIVVINPNYA